MTIIDYATCYPKVAALTDSSVKTVVEPLANMFISVGFPKETLSDQKVSSYILVSWQQQLLKFHDS